jgi:hypothetical protein
MATRLQKTKLRAVAQLAQFCVRNPDLLTDNLIPQTLGIAIRKLHDFGNSDLGKGKYLGHAFWSRRARILLAKNGGTDNGIKLHLAHEHVIPVKLVVDELLALKPESKITEFERLIRRLSRVAIITREEEIKMLRPVKLSQAPSERWYFKDPWWRYRKAKLLRSIVDESGRRVDA